MKLPYSIDERLLSDVVNTFNRQGGRNHKREKGSFLEIISTVRGRVEKCANPVISEITRQ